MCLGMKYVCIHQINFVIFSSLRLPFRSVVRIYFKMIVCCCCFIVFSLISLTFVFPFLLLSIATVIYYMFYYIYNWVPLDCIVKIRHYLRENYLNKALYILKRQNLNYLFKEEETVNWFMSWLAMKNNYLTF